MQLHRVVLDFDGCIKRLNQDFCVEDYAYACEGFRVHGVLPKRPVRPVLLRPGDHA